MRVKHYIKNFLILLPLIFSGNLRNREAVLSCAAGFFAFSLASSAVYILNDIADVEKDRAHPVKRNRPIAGGAVSVKNAALCGVLCLCGAGPLLTLGRRSGALCVLAYLALNVLYSFSLKNRAFWDVTILASGFFLRLLYGAVLTGVSISGWLYLTVISISFYMALGKRRNELRKSGTDSRAALQFYTPEFLDKNMYMCVCLANVFFSLWAMDAGGKMLAAAPMVLLLSMRYSYDIEREESHGDPVDIILRDRAILLGGLACAAYMVFVLYASK